MRDFKQPFAVGMLHRTDVKPLTEDEIAFEIDMCIGCDRCMRACPVPLSAMITIAELNQATVTDTVDPHIARFTDECVMCGSCVPVCPVDNHRDLLMLSLKQRLGMPWDGKVDMNHLLSNLPAGWDVPLVLSRLREQAMFKDSQLVLENYLLHFIATSKLRSPEPDTIIMYEGEFGRSIYFILEGRCELFSIGPDGQDMPIAILQRSEYMGEQGMLSGQPRNTSARALTPMIILEVPEQVMQHLMEMVPTVQQFCEQLNTVQTIETILRGVELFEGVSAEDIRQMAISAQLKRYDREERLFGEDTKEQRETLHIVLDGFVKVARHTAEGTGRNKSDERIIAYRQRGDYFAGGLDLLGDRQAASVTAITRTSVAEFSRQMLQPFFQRYPQVVQRFQERLQSYRDANAAAFSGVFAPLLPSELNTLNVLSDPAARAGLHALVADGVVEGTEVLVIDLDRCIHCSECEDACERRHGHSRLNRTGMVVGNMSITTACRQCQDPVCMLCSRAGIARMPSGEVYITESCIGCGICAERCPYDNISIITLDEEAQPIKSSAQASWQQFTSFFSKGSGKEYGRKVLPMAKSAPASGPLNRYEHGDAIGEIRKKLAIKCDLCAGYNNQACVQACPTGAAFRVNPVTFFGSTEEILRKRVV